MTDQKNNRGWFKKGVSGNPKGRPKGSRNQSSLLEEVINALVSVTENGKKKMITKREAALIQLVNKAAGGDLRATKMLEDMYERHCKEKILRPQEVSPSTASAGPVTEEEAAKRYHEALKRATADE